MRRARLGAQFFGGVAACLGICACQPQLATRPSEPGPSPQQQSRPYEPLVFDPFTSPFAIVEAKPNQTECLLPQAEGMKWKAVPPPRAKLGSQVRTGPRQFEKEREGFCVYEWRSETTTPSRTDFTRIGGTPDGAVIAVRDHPPSDFPVLPDTVSGPLLRSFEKLAHGIDPGRWKELVKSRLENPRKTVRVAVVDATPKGLLERDNSLHGFAVSNVVGRLLCGDPRSSQCADKIRPYLALPMNGPRSEDFKNGGRFGTFFQLYDALSEALSDWPKDEHLVINLSLGWDPVKTEDNDPRVERIKSLLERAVCRGAIIIAGAGNPTGTEGPVEPGAFEEFRAPDSKRCDALIAQEPSPPMMTTVKTARLSKGKIAQLPYAPLVYAVGALDSRDQRLMADRRWGQPRLAAFGLNVMVPGPSNIPFTPPLTGTSASAAIVSGIAAAVWSVLPNLDGPSVMAIVYRGGVELDGGEKSKRARTEFCLGEHFGPCLDQKVHRAFLCGALSRALAQDGDEQSLVCDTSISTEGPKWPDTRIRKERLEPCRIPHCGMPEGPLPSQRVSGVASQGFANCPGCVVSVNPGTLLGTLHGTPHISSPMPSGDVFAAVVDISVRSTIRSYWFSPAPPSDNPMSQPQMSGVPVTASASTITWYHWTGPGWEPDAPIHMDPPIIE